MNTYGSYLVETCVTLMGVCGLAFAVLFGARRLGVGRARGPVSLVGQLLLDSRRAIYLVRVGAQVLVVGATDSGFTKLGEASAEELDGLEPASPPPSFADAFARAVRRTRAEGSRGAATVTSPAPTREPSP